MQVIELSVDPDALEYGNSSRAAVLASLNTNLMRVNSRNISIDN